MTCHHPDLSSASDWLKQIPQAAQPIRSITQIWVVTRHQYGISVLISQTWFHWETSDGVAKCLLFSQAIFLKLTILPCQAVGSRLNDWRPSFHLHRPVKSTLLDILLLRASGWKVEEDSDEQETGNEFSEGEVFIEDDMTEEQQPEATKENDEDEGLYA